MLRIVKFQEFERIVAFPYPVRMAGFAHRHVQLPGECRYPYLEFCLRLGSDAERTEDHIGGGRWISTYPHVIVKHPGIPHRFGSTEHRECVILIYAPETAEKLAALGLVPPPGVYSFTPDAELNGKLGEIRKLLADPCGFSVADRMDLVCFEVLEELRFQWIAEKKTQKSSREEKRIASAASFLSLHLDSEIDFEQLARRNGFSLRSFFRAWARHRKLPPAKYLHELRMRHAEFLLGNTSEPVSRVAKLSGFRNDAYFTTCFSRHAGKTPQEFRRSGNQR